MCAVHKYTNYKKQNILDYGRWFKDFHVKVQLTLALRGKKSTSFDLESKKFSGQECDFGGIFLLDLTVFLELLKLSVPL